MAKLSDNDPRLAAVNHIRQIVCAALKEHGIRTMNLVFALKPEGFQTSFCETFSRGPRTLVFGQRRLRDGEWAVGMTLGQTDPADPKHPTHAFEIVYSPGPLDQFRRFGPGVAGDARWSCTVDDSPEALELMAALDPRLSRCTFEPSTPETARRRLDTALLDAKNRRYHASPFFMDLAQKMVGRLAAGEEA